MYQILSGNSYTVLPAQELLSIFETAYFPSLVDSTILTDTSNLGIYSNQSSSTDNIYTGIQKFQIF
jgi:hypothetical protein